MIGDIPMRRFENQIHDREIIRAILDNILIVHVGINEDPYPYIVPLSFGYEMTEERLLIYLHSAREGHKVDLWTKDPHVSLTFSTLSNHPNDLYRGAMHDFRCIMANGVIRKIERPQNSGQHGRAVQAILRHNDRRCNQFSVPHYMFMDVYVVECEWRHVTAKSEEPMKHAGEVSFPNLEAIRKSTEPPYDYSYFLSRKIYQPDCRTAVPCKTELPLLPEAVPLETSFPLEFRFQWDCAETDFDCDILAAVLDQSGKLARRYDIAFYNQKTDRSGAVQHLGDDILTVRGQEAIAVDWNAMPNYCSQIIFLLAVYEADSRNHNLGMLQRLQMCVRSSKNRQCEYAIPCAWSGKQAAAAAKLVRQTDGAWILSGPDGMSLDDWHLTTIFAHYGLKRWKE